MVASFDTTFRRLVRSAPEQRESVAADLLDRKVEWPDWMRAFNALHVKEPEREAVAAGVLAAAAGRRRRPGLAGRFRVLEGRALQRAGSPGDAARSYRRASTALRACGDHEWATQSDVLCVDALAVSGRVADAVRLAERARPRIRGPRARLWRAALAVNEANALRLRGDLKAAIRAYLRAARTAEAAGDAHTAAIARTNAGVAHMDAGDAEAARELLASAVSVFESAGQTDMALEARYNLAGALVRCGRLGEGLGLLEGLEAEHASRGLHRRAALCGMDLADAFLRAGDHVAAEKKALAAVEAFRRSGARAERVEALWVAAAAAAPHRPREASAHLRRARSAALRVGRPAWLLRCDVLRVDLDVGRGRLPSSSQLAPLLRRARELGQHDIAAQVLLLRGHAALERGRVANALRAFSDPLLNRPGRPWARAAGGAGRALAEARLGRPGAALTRLRALAGFLDAVRSELPGSWLRTVFVLDRLDPYLSRIDLLLERGSPDDRREAEAVLDALAARRFVEGSAPRPATRDVRTRLEAIYDRLARGNGPTRGLEVGEQAGLEREARRLEREAAESWRREERRASAGTIVAMAAPEPAPLRSDVTAVHVWERRDRVCALVRHGNAIDRVVDLGPTAALGERLEMLAFHDERARRRPEAGRVLESAHADLSDDFLGALDASSWRRNVRLVVDPGLPDVPWETLSLDGRPLVSARRFVRVPALRVRTAVRTGTRGTGTTVLALGEVDLPGSRREVRALGRSARVLTGSGATRAAVGEALATSDVVHLTGHGFDAPEAPALGGVRVADGWFGAMDLPERIRARLVVLAACRTGRAAGTPGLAWGGLPSALLARGAHYVLWTAADVDDGATADLMERFHTASAAVSPPEAFGRALDETRSARGNLAGLLDFRMTGFE